MLAFLSTRPTNDESMAKRASLRSQLEMDLRRISEGRHHDPHSVLGIHERDGARARAGLPPAARDVRLDGRYRQPPASRTRIFSPGAARAAELATHYSVSWTDAHGSPLRTSRSLLVPAAARHAGGRVLFQRPASRRMAIPRRARHVGRWRCGRALRRVGAGCGARQRRRPVLSIGMGAAIPCACSAAPAYGSCSFPASARARSTSSRSGTGIHGAISAESRSVCACCRAAARDGIHRHATVIFRVARRRVDRATRGARLAARADEHLRGAPGLVAPATTTAASSTIARSRTSSRRTRSGSASRTSSCCRSPSIRSTTRGVIRRRATSRRPAGTARRTTCATSSTSVITRHRRAARLGARALSPRRAWPRELRRHARSTNMPTRARPSTRTGARSSSTTSGTKCAPSCCRARTTGCTSSTSTACASTPVASMLYLDFSKQRRRVRAEQARRHAQPRSHRVPARAERGDARRVPRHARSSRKSRRTGRRSRARPTWAASASR